METQNFKSVFGAGKVGMGVIHLAALPGSPGYGGDMGAIVSRAVAEAQALEKAGFGGLVVENYGDIPFCRDAVGPETVSAMALVIKAVCDRVGLPVGVNVLRNDARAALALAGVCGAAFIRVNVLVGAFVTSEGVIEGKPAEVMRLRGQMAPGCLVLADIMVKHGAPLAATGIKEQALDAAERGLADGVIVTGTRTGLPPDLDDVRAAAEALRQGTRQVPVLVGSGAGPSNLDNLLEAADGVIVGSYLRKGGVAGAALDDGRVAEMGRLLGKYR
jgi:membrane complex biogenesis BtpA family protein